jgi:hypothetical protein
VSIEQDRARYSQIESEQSRLLKEKLKITDRLARVGEHDHIHGDGTYESPNFWHIHSFDDSRHEHAEKREDADGKKDKVRRGIPRDAGS